MSNTNVSGVTKRSIQHAERIVARAIQRLDKQGKVLTMTRRALRDSTRALHRIGTRSYAKKKTSN